MAKLRPSLDDFTLLKVLGQGSYGKVVLVKHQSKPDTVYAMKMLKKEHIALRNQVAHTKTERNVLETVLHPFIVTLHFAFQTPKKLYFVLEFCPGGELFYHLSRVGRFSEARCSFYSSELLLVIEYLHKRNIIYRDLKPENILLSTSGHVKLTDFGLSKEGIEDNFSARTVCGTPEYLAPEIVDRSGHGKAVDWYSLGALMFEMVTGLPPFYSTDRAKLLDQIRRGSLKYPTYLSSEGTSVLKSLLHRDPTSRLGGGTGDGEEVKAHAFFAGTDWAAVYEQRRKPPFTPDITNNGDVKYFEKEFVNLPVVNSDAPMSEEDRHHFDGFTFQRVQRKKRAPSWERDQPTGGKGAATEAAVPDAMVVDS
mmetsp:Transcript_66712/g.150646  ORF Transcript_66712/g.150646 Transcript_66712/m.150646 type:complete len:366 (-) Transcript_66712:233-1330(-)